MPNTATEPLPENQPVGEVKPAPEPAAPPEPDLLPGALEACQEDRIVSITEPRPFWWKLPYVKEILVDPEIDPDDMLYEVRIRVRGRDFAIFERTIKLPVTCALDPAHRGSSIMTTPSMETQAFCHAHDRLRQFMDTVHGEFQPPTATKPIKQAKTVEILAPPPLELPAPSSQLDEIPGNLTVLPADKPV